MMKNLALIGLMSTLACSSFVYAGAMGEAGSLNNAAFITLEGGYAKSSLDGYAFTINSGALGGVASVKKNTYYAGRLGAGMTMMMEDDIGFTGEIGYGYYGRTTFTPNIVSPLFQYTNKYTVSGLDALVGMAYIQPYYSVSLKLGALVQNLQLNSQAVDQTLSTEIGALTLKNNTTAVLPEVKMGFAYNINPNWSITAAYMLAYGATNKIRGNFNTVTGVTTLTDNSQNPMLNVGLLGVQYNIC